jgi:hypothetical protein
MQRTRRRFDGVILSLMLCHAAAAGLSGFAVPEAAPSPGKAGQACRCCCSGGGMPTCPMVHRQAEAGSCHLRCGPGRSPVLVVGVAAVPLPDVDDVVTVVSAALSISPRSGFSTIVLPVPAPPPRAASSRS